MEVDYRIKGESRLEQGLEDNLGLPVVVTKAGTTFVIEAKGRDAKVFTEGNMDCLLAGLNKKRGARRNVPVRIHLRYPEIPAASARMALRRIESAAADKPEAGGRRYVQMNIDGGPRVFEWEGLRKYVEEVFSGFDRKKTVAGLAIDGEFSQPDEKQKDWLARNRIKVRYVFGPALGYAGESNGDAKGILRTMSEYGLRAPVLFYWAGERKEVVAEVLRSALRHNKLSGIGILPYFFSPRFNCYADIPSDGVNGFGDVVEFLLEDRMLGDYLDEPISYIEERLAGTANSQCMKYSVNAEGALLPFRRFAFTPGEHGITMYGRCRDCVWKHICGGIDSSPRENKRQYKVIAEAWCVFQKTFMRRIARECLEIREYMHKHNGKMPEAAS
ncbi:MAG: hypothetical protein JW749_10675 [Sedimentisphaerales bacterium]|nr:hypothetical protein [Sedimentisphaerales bacterium]